VIEILKDNKENIKAVCEWQLVDSNGNFKQNGEFVWISEVEISSQYRNNGILKVFARIIMTKAPQAKFGYFWRQKKYPNRKIKIYHKYQWLKLIGEAKNE